jgi:hypothetical protein
MKLRAITAGSTLRPALDNERSSICYLRIAAVEGGVTKSMVELNVVTTRLQLMRQQILPLMDALLKGAPDEGEERNLRVAELERISDNLRLIVRDIQSERYHLQAMHRNYR